MRNKAVTPSLVKKTKSECVYQKVQELFFLRVERSLIIRILLARIFLIIFFVKNRFLTLLPPHRGSERFEENRLCSMAALNSGFSAIAENRRTPTLSLGGKPRALEHSVRVHQPSCLLILALL